VPSVATAGVLHDRSPSVNVHATFRRVDRGRACRRATRRTACRRGQRRQADHRAADLDVPALGRRLDRRRAGVRPRWRRPPPTARTAAGRHHPGRAIRRRRAGGGGGARIDAAASDAHPRALAVGSCRTGWAAGTTRARASDSAATTRSQTHHDRDATRPRPARRADPPRLGEIVREPLGQLLEVAAGLFEDRRILIGVHADAVGAARIGGHRPHRQPADDPVRSWYRSASTSAWFSGTRKVRRPSSDGRPESFDQLRHGAVRSADT
jgi:hypothetical protein